MENKSLISIVIPVYNGRNYLERTVKSLQEQTYTNFEACFVDDGSTDGSVDYIKGMENIDNRIKLFCKPHGGIVPKSLNYIIPKLKGDYYYYMSQDDYFSSDLLQNCIDRQQETNADIVLPTCLFCNDETVENIIAPPIEVLSGEEAYRRALKFKMHGFSLIRMSLLKDELFDETTFNSDEYMTYKLLSKARIVAGCKGTFYYNRPVNSITKSPKPYRCQRLKTDQMLWNLTINTLNEFKPKAILAAYMFHNICKIKSFISRNKEKWSETEIQDAASIYKDAITKFPWQMIIPSMLVCPRKSINSFIILLFGEK